MNNLSWSDFEKIDIRVGTIIEIQEFPEARNPAYQVWINFGKEIGVKKSSAQITELYDFNELKGKQIIAVINFPKKQISTFMSECLILGVVKGNEVTLLTPDKKVEDGLKIS